MKARHHRQHRARGGGVNPNAEENAGVYAGASSNVIKEAHDKSGKFKRGGRVKHEAHAEGDKPHHRRDKKARGGAVGGSPFSSAAKLGNEPREVRNGPHNE